MIQWWKVQNVNSLCRRRRQQNLCTLSSAADWTTAAVCWLVSLVSCCTDCKWSRMPLLILLPEPRGTSIWRQFCAVCTGYLFGIGSCSRQQSPCTSVSTVWHRHSSQSTARWRHPLLVAATCDLPTFTSSSFHARGQVTATVVSPFMVPSCGILCHATSGQLTYLLPHSEIDSKHSCLMLTRSSAFAALANLGYTSDIIFFYTPGSIDYYYYYLPVNVFNDSLYNYRSFSMLSCEVCFQLWTFVAVICCAGFVLLRNRLSVHSPRSDCNGSAVGSYSILF